MLLSARPLRHSLPPVGARLPSPQTEPPLPATWPSAQSAGIPNIRLPPSTRTPVCAAHPACLCGAAPADPHPCTATRSAGPVPVWQRLPFQVRGGAVRQPPARGNHDRRHARRARCCRLAPAPVSALPRRRCRLPGPRLQLGCLQLGYLQLGPVALLRCSHLACLQLHVPPLRAAVLQVCCLARNSASSAATTSSRWSAGLRRAATSSCCCSIPTSSTSATSSRR